MTLGKFQKLLKKIDPKLRLRVRRQGDVVGLFVGHSGKSGYICRMSKGELHLRGYKMYWKDPEGNLQSRITKRGRMTVVNLLRSYRWIQNHKQRSMLIYGIPYPDEEVRGLSCGGTGSNV